MCAEHRGDVLFLCWKLITWHSCTVLASVCVWRTEENVGARHLTDDELRTIDAVKIVCVVLIPCVVIVASVVSTTWGLIVESTAPLPFIFVVFVQRVS